MQRCTGFANVVPELILMDIQLPDMDGLALTRLLKNDHVLIVALTSFAMKDDDEKACAAGCDGYLPKPINTRTFSAQIAEFPRVSS